MSITKPEGSLSAWSSWSGLKTKMLIKFLKILNLFLCIRAMAMEEGIFTSWWKIPFQEWKMNVDTTRWAQAPLWVITGKLTDVYLTHPSAGKRKETWPTYGATYIHSHQEETGTKDLWADWVNSISLLWAMHAKHITCLISLHSNNPIGHMPIVTQLIGVELGYESDLKPGA